MKNFLIASLCMIVGLVCCLLPLVWVDWSLAYWSNKEYVEALVCFLMGWVCLYPGILLVYSSHAMFNFIGKPKKIKKKHRKF